MSYIQAAQYLRRHDSEIAEKLFCKNGIRVMINFSGGKTSMADWCELAGIEF